MTDIQAMRTCHTTYIHMYKYITILAQAMPICVTGVCWPQCLLYLGDICTMGSYGDRRMPCTWCGREGQCLWPEYLAAPHLVSLFDVDGIGPICDRCSDRGRPPQYEYMAMVLPRLGGLPEVMDLLAEYVFQVCADFARPRPMLLATGAK